MELKIILRFVAQHWKIARQELQYDLRNTRWAWGFTWFLFIVVWCGGLLAALVFIPSTTTNFNLFPGSLSPCLPDGSFSLRPDLYNAWTISGVFEITLGFGSLTFANAKLIDVIWDMVSGRAHAAYIKNVTDCCYPKGSRPRHSSHPSPDITSRCRQIHYGHNGGFSHIVRNL
jgi:hypothetical protein